MSSAPMPAPAPPPATTDQVYLVVRTDRALINRWRGRVVALHGVFVVVLLALVFGLSAVLGDYLAWYSLLPFAILVLGEVYQLGFHCYAWGARVTLDVPLVVSAAGADLHTAQGRVRLSWAAVESVTVRGNLFGAILVVKPWPNVAAGGPGVQIEVPPRVWARMLRGGILLGAKGVQPGLPEIMAAMRAASAGRVRIG